MLVSFDFYLARNLYINDEQYTVTKSLGRLSRRAPGSQGAESACHEGMEPRLGVYSSFAAISRWEAKKPGLAAQWPVDIDGLSQWVSLDDNGNVGVSPEQILCQRWVNQRLSGCYHIEDLRVLNLFAGSGGVREDFIIFFYSLIGHTGIRRHVFIERKYIYMSLVCPEVQFYFVS